MSNIFIVIVIVIVSIFAIFVAALLIRRRLPQTNSELGLLHQRFDALNSQVVTQMQQMQSLMLQQLQEHRTTLNQTNQSIGSRLDQASLIFGKVQERLAQLEEGSKRIFEVGKDLSSLQDILKTPKLRGSLGELFLGDMLGQILHHDQYKLQYNFKSGETVDAVVKLKDGLMVPIDSKFPLENFRRVLACANDTQRESMRKIFRADVKKHIDAISQKYILPNEGTFDFALMYIPAENVYYEIILKDDSDGALLPYAFGKRVIPVSPNTLYIYLQAILLGLKGLKIEEEAVSILKHLSMLSNEFGKFTKDYAVLGGHLTNAQTKYLETERQIGKISLQLETIDSHTEILPDGKMTNDQ